MLAICGGFQLLGQYYIEAGGRKIDGLGIMGHYTLNQTNNRYIGDIKIHNDEFNETYYGFENHQGRTFLADNQNRWARLSTAMAITRKTAAKVCTTKTPSVATSTDQSYPAMPTWPTAWSLLPSAKNTDKTSNLPATPTSSAKKSLKNTAM